MPYLNPHMLLTIGGKLGSTEGWSIGLRFRVVSSVPASQAMVDGTVAPIRAWFNASTSGFPTAHSVDLIKLVRINVDGKYFPFEDAVEASIGTAINGAIGTASLPFQISEVISLTTALTRGRGHIGRVYLPPLASSVLGGASISSSVMTGMLANFRAMVLSLNALNPGFGVLAVMGKTGTGTEHEVTGFRGGLVPDTQRRRRNGLNENYQTLAL